MSNNNGAGSREGSAAQNTGVSGNALKGDTLASNGPRPTALKVNPLVKPSRPTTSAPFLRSSRPVAKPLRNPTSQEVIRNLPSMFSPKGARTPSPTKGKAFDLTPKGTYASPQRPAASNGGANGSANGGAKSGLFDPKSDDWNRAWNLADLRKELEQTNMSELATHSKPKYVMPSRRGTSPMRSNMRNGSMTAESRIEKVMGTLNDISSKSIVVPENFKVHGLEPELLKHQVEGVTFMTAREASKDSASGGFLCDDMGLGKTVQSIALILNAPPKADSKRKTTLVVGPLAVMDQWVQEIRSKAPKLKVVSHQGSTRAKTFKELENYDVVVTTYNVVTSENKTQGALFQGKWRRIIADEGHEFRNPKTALAGAMWALKSKGRRWVLTGTPIHNDVNDLFSLFKFVGVEPYDDWESWKADIGDPIKKATANTANAVKLLSGLLHSLMLRREQVAIKDLLPPVKRVVVPLTLSSEDRLAYDNVLRPQLDFACETPEPDPKDPDQESGKTQELPIVLISRLRQACDDPALLPGRYCPSEPKEKAVAKKEEKANSFDDIDDLASALSKTTIDNQESKSQWSSKITAIRKILLQDRARKCVVFSSFVSMLNRIGRMLDEEGIGYRIYDGSLTASERQGVLDSFRNDDNTLVLLCSLNCAAVGINIVCASRVILAEPWWNPMISDQAVNRVHRLGQTKPVDVYEMMAKDVIEERVIEIQKKKRRLVANIMEKQEKLSPQEVKYLIYG